MLKLSKPDKNKYVDMGDMPVGAIAVIRSSRILHEAVDQIVYHYTKGRYVYLTKEGYWGQPPDRGTIFVELLPPGTLLEVI